MKSILYYLIHLFNKIFPKKNRESFYKRLGIEPDKPDSRDYKVSLQYVKQLPKSYYIKELPPIRNQSWLNSCCSHAVVGSYEIMLLNKKPKQFIEGSELFHFYNARKYINLTYPKNSGMTIRDGCKTIHKFGNAPEITWRYKTNLYNKEPNKLAYWFANLYKINKYERLYDLADIKQALVNGFPVICGIRITDSFYTLDSVNRVYRPRGAYHGGHAVIIVGYDDTTNRLKIRNSWGEKWGLNGYFYMDYTDFLNNSFDYWIIYPDLIYKDRNGI